VRGYIAEATKWVGGLLLVAAGIVVITMAGLWGFVLEDVLGIETKRVVQAPASACDRIQGELSTDDYSVTWTPDDEFRARATRRCREDPIQAENGNFLFVDPQTDAIVRVDCGRRTP
jgi:hypothetical protein